MRLKECTQGFFEWCIEEAACNSAGNKLAKTSWDNLVWWRKSAFESDRRRLYAVHYYLHRHSRRYRGD